MGTVKIFWLLLQALILFLSLLLPSCSSSATTNRGKEKQKGENAMSTIPSVSVIPARFTEWQEEIPLLGTAFADSQYQLSVEEGGRVERVFVHAGEYVEKGESLLEMNIPDITQLIKAGNIKAQIADKKIALAKFALEEELQLAESSELLSKKRRLKLKRLEEEKGRIAKKVAESEALFRAGTISLEELEKEKQLLEHIDGSIEEIRIDMEIGENSRSDPVGKETELELRELERAQLELGLQSLERRIERSLLTAPINGMVSGVFIDEGEMVASGQRAIHLFDPSSIKIRIPVPNRYFNRLSKGNRIIFPSLNKGAGPLQGEVEAIVPQSDGDGRFVLIARGQDGALPILPGSRHRVILESSRHIKGVLLEPEMIIDMEGAQSHLLLVQEERLLFRKVRSVETEHGYIWITEGLVEGDLICSSLPPLFHEGMSVHPELSSGENPLQGENHE